MRLSDFSRVPVALFESFDAPVPIHWEDRSVDDVQFIYGNFWIDGGHFVVRCTHAPYNPGLWEISFLRNDSYDLTGTGNAALVFSTVLEAVRQFLREIHPRIVMISAKKSEGSRLKLYPKLIALLRREFPEYTERPNEEPSRSRYQNFTFERPRDPIPVPSAPRNTEDADDGSLRPRWTDEHERLYRELIATESARSRRGGASCRSRLV